MASVIVSDGDIELGNSNNNKNNKDNKPSDEEAAVMKQIYELVAVREQRKSHIIELGLHLFFTLIFLIIISLQRSIYGSFQMNQGLSSALVTQQINYSLQPFPKTFLDVGSWDEVRDFLVNVVGGTLDNDNYYNGAPYTSDIERASIQYNNRLIGGIRLRQLRVRNDSCDIPRQLQPVANTCFDDVYRSSTRDTAPYGPNNIYTFTEYNKSEAVWGYAGEWYEGGGYIVDLPLGSNFTDRIQELIDNKWYDQATRAIIISLITVNVHLNARMAVSYLIFEMKAGGAITPTQITKMFRVNLYRNNEDYFRGVLEAIFVIMIGYWIVAEVKEFRKGVVESESWLVACRNYFFSMWNLLELTNLLAFTITVGMYIGYIASPIRNIDLYGVHYLPVLEVLASNATIYYNISAFNILICALRTFKYFRLNARMSYLWSALSNASGDLFSFLVMFLILLVAFLFFGWISFGTDLEIFSTFMNSLGSCWAFVLGNPPDYIMVSKSNRVLGPLFVMMFTIFIVFFMVNMFVAILTDSLAAVRETKNTTVEPTMNTVWSVLLHYVISRFTKKPFRTLRELVDGMKGEARKIFCNKEAKLEDMKVALQMDMVDITEEETERVYYILAEFHNIPVEKWQHKLTKKDLDEQQKLKYKPVREANSVREVQDQLHQLQATFQAKLQEQQTVWQRQFEAQQTALQAQHQEQINLLKELLAKKNE